MTVVTLSFIEEGQRIIEGIPEFIKIESNLPTLIFYTLDESLPTMASTQYDGYAFVLPTDDSVVNLSAIGYFLDGYGDLTPSAVFSVAYTLDFSEAYRIRGRDFEGVVYSYPGGLNIPFWYDSDGDAKVFIDIPLDEFNKEFSPSFRNADGTIREGESLVTKKQSASETQTTRDDDTLLFSTPSSADFDPRALYIVIDGRDRSPEDVPIVNGPYMSLRDSEKNWGGADFLSTRGSNQISGSLLKYYVNREKGIVVFYYFDSSSNRWIKSIQNLPAIDTSTLRNPIWKVPMVFRWNNFGKHQGI